MIEIELRKTNIAAYGSVEVKSNVSPICKLARLLIADHDLFEPVRVTRNGTQCFSVIPLWRWARVSANEPSGMSVRLGRYRANRYTETGE